MLSWDRLRAHNVRLRLWRGVTDEIVRAPMEPILHPSTARLQWLGIFTFGGHFLFGWLWGWAIPQPYEIPGLRVVLALTGLVLLRRGVNRDLTSRTSVWVFGIIFWVQLPLFFGWMFLMNEGNKVWLASVCAMILIYFNITDWRLASLGIATGFASAAGLFLLMRTGQAWVGFDPENMTLIAFSLTMSLMLGMSSANLRRVRLLNTLRAMGVMAHELRTPLATVNLVGDVLGGMALDDMPEAQRKKKLAELSQRLKHLVRGMNRQIDTQISNAQLLRLPRPTTQLDAFELVQDVVGQYPFRGPRERHCVELALEQNFCFLGARAPCAQVMGNLIKNALHALAATGTPLSAGDLRIAVTVQNGRGRITVSDKGVGIPVRKQQRIFEPFYSLQSSGGNGLGLPFCKNVVEASDGRMMLTSEHGKGATFIIELPLSNGRAPFVFPSTNVD